MECHESSYEASGISSGLYMDKYDILSNGAIIIPEGEYIEFIFENLRFRFKSSIEDNNKDPNVLISLEKDTEPQYVLINFINQKVGYSGGFSDPVVLATLNDRKLFLIFKNESLNASKGTNILLHYTWLLEKK